MEKRIIWRGMLAGAIGGLLAFVFARIFAEPQIQQAIDYEDGRDHAQEALNSAAGIVPHEHGEVFSRAVQGNVGIGVGLILFGVAMGALFAVAYAICLGRTGRVRPRTLALLVAGGGFLGIYLVPFVKYPANPPAIGDADTIQQRSSYYLLMVVGSILLLVLTVWLGKRLQARFGTWNATLIAGGVFIAATAIVMLVLPRVAETPQPLTDASGTIVFPGFPADVLFHFRFYAIGAQLVLWATIGLVFAPMAERLLAGAPARPAPALVNG
ncbi:CbtA family protein [Actinoplanes sp. KI2]|uniref:CbtA family protein n=1 Tax=Actinoplanes sp. KI2 TaxID=2983315 RepID=UPI0021D60FAD|nr:CbtA family protein [Actinoplanes sp. KI2]MCU7726440.1 CbtA family protein [Actinoplanes sp. KI2]